MTGKRKDSTGKRRAAHRKTAVSVEKKQEQSNQPQKLTSERITNLRKAIGKELHRDEKKELYNDISFTFFAPLACEVRLAGSFTRWAERSIVMKQSGDGHWHTTIKLKPGRYEYKYIIDGQWENAQHPAEVITNEQGITNSIVTVHA